MTRTDTTVSATASRAKLDYMAPFIIAPTMIVPSLTADEGSATTALHIVPFASLATVTIGYEGLIRTASRTLAYPFRMKAYVNNGSNTVLSGEAMGASTMIGIARTATAAAGQVMVRAACLATARFEAGRNLSGGLCVQWPQPTFTAARRTLAASQTR